MLYNRINSQFFLHRILDHANSSANFDNHFRSDPGNILILSHSSFRHLGVIFVQYFDGELEAVCWDSWI